MGLARAAETKKKASRVVMLSELPDDNKTISENVGELWVLSCATLNGDGVHYWQKKQTQRERASHLFPLRE